jgi:16S rRNA processing protein RimM
MLQPLESGQYYEHQLIGCRAETVGNDVIGPVIRVEGGAGGSRLVVDGRYGEILIPLATHICVEIDVAGRKIRVDPPEGLLELNETKRGRQSAAGGGQ